jgi:hypothetical protein
VNEIHEFRAFGENLGGGNILVLLFGFDVGGDHYYLLRMPGKLSDSGTVVSRHSGKYSVLYNLHRVHFLTSPTDVRIERCFRLHIVFLTFRGRIANTTSLF